MTPTNAPMTLRRDDRDPSAAAATRAAGDGPHRMQVPAAGRGDDAPPPGAPGTRIAARGPPRRTGEPRTRTAPMSRLPAPGTAQPIRMARRLRGKRARMTRGTGAAAMPTGTPLAARR